MFQCYTVQFPTENKSDHWWLNVVVEVVHQAPRTLRELEHSITPDSPVVWRLTAHVRLGVVTAPLMTQNRKSAREICSNKEELFKMGLQTQFSIDSLFSHFPRRKMRKYPIKFGLKTEFIFWNIMRVQSRGERRVLVKHAGGDCSDLASPNNNIFIFYLSSLAGSGCVNINQVLGQWEFKLELSRAENEVYQVKIMRS